MTIQNHSHHHANTIGNFDPFTPPTFPPRPTAYCRCGTRLSQYRPPQTSLCWSCEQSAPTKPLKLHPPTKIEAICPTCGGTMFHTSARCNHCRYTR